MLIINRNGQIEPASARGGWWQSLWRWLGRRAS